MKVEKQTASNTKVLTALGKQFGWYWYSERVKCFAVIGRINKDRAELIVFNSRWSGGFSLIDDSPLFIEDPTIPADEQPKAGKWEPLVEMEDIIDAATELVEKALAGVAGGPSSATAADTPAA